jgi:hypothetical protein
MDGSISVRPSRSARLRMASGFAVEIAAANPHMRGRDVETVVATIFDEIASALARGDRWNGAALGLLPSDAERRMRAAPRGTGLMGINTWEGLFSYVKRSGQVDLVVVSVLAVESVDVDAEFPGRSIARSASRRPAAPGGRSGRSQNRIPASPESRTHLRRKSTSCSRTIQLRDNQHGAGCAAECQGGGKLRPGRIACCSQRLFPL